MDNNFNNENITEVKEENKEIHEQKQNKESGGSLRFLTGLLTGLLIAVAALVFIYFVAVYQSIHKSAAATSDSSSNSQNATQTADGETDVETLDEDAITALESKIDTLLRGLYSDYYYSIDADAMDEAVCDAIIEALGDKYAAYYTAEEYAELLENYSGTFSGINATVVEGETGAVITSVTEGGAAEKAGILVGDIIISVDGVDVTKYSLEELVAAVRGDEGSEVNIIVLRDDEEIEFTIVRETVDVASVYYGIYDDNVLYIQITGFESNTPEQFEEALNYGIENNVSGIVFDVRNNGGGLLTSINSVLDMLLDDGMIVYMEDNEGVIATYEATEGTIVSDIPMVVLVNEYTASAAELFASCLRDRLDVTLVGQTTYGKGVAQTAYMLSDGSAYKYTYAQYFSASGYDINGNGLVPDVLVDIDESAAIDNVIYLEDDTQYAAALEKIKELIAE